MVFVLLLACLAQGELLTLALEQRPERLNDLDVSFQEKDGQVTFHVPQVNVYEIAAVTMK